MLEDVTEMARDRASLKLPQTPGIEDLMTVKPNEIIATKSIRSSLERNSDLRSSALSEPSLLSVNIKEPNADKQPLTEGLPRSSIENIKTSSWGPAERYKKNRKSSFPDYGPSLSRASKPEPMVRPVTNGPQPMNRLGEKASPNTTLKAHSPQAKRIDPNEYLRKKHKTARQTSSNHSIIELDGPDATWPQIKAQPSTKKSSIVSKELRILVPELQSVEKQVRLRRRRNRGSNCSESRPLHFNQSKNLLSDSSRRIGDDPKDPIVDGDGDSIDQISSERATSSSIYSLASEIPLGCCKGISKPQQPHGAKKSWGPSVRPSISPHFPQIQKHHHELDTAASSTQQLVKSSKRVKNSGVRKTDCPSEEIDEIAASHFYQNTSKNEGANSLLKAKLNPANASVMLNRVGRNYLSSDEERHSVPGTISQSNLTSKTPKARASAKIHAWKIREAFTEKCTWHLENRSDINWLLLLDRENQLLKFDGTSQFPSFSFSVNCIIKICLAEPCTALMVIKKSLGKESRPKVFLQFSDIEECISMQKEVRKSNKSINFEILSDEKLMRIFENQRNTERNRLKLKGRHEAEVFTLSHSNSCNKVRVHEAIQPKPKGIAKSMKTRAEYTVSNAEDLASIQPNTSNQAEAIQPRPKGIAKSMKIRSEHTVSAAEVEPIGNSGHITSDRHQDSSPDTRRLRTRLSRTYIAKHTQKSTARSKSPSRWTSRNPDWAENWHSSVIFPREADKKNKAIVDPQDIQRLDEGEFLNDNLVTFYLRWLQNEIEENNPQVARRVYFHNNFFYEGLTKRRGSRTGINYENVERWTSKVNLFEYDYIIIPVCENYHWYVAIICNAPKLVPNKIRSDAILDSSNTITRMVSRGQGNGCVSELASASHQISASNHASPDIAATTEILEIGVNIPNANYENEFLKLLENPDTEGQVTAPASQGNRRKSSRSNDPTDPRIITLDSLGVSRSSACSNLKKYLLREMESKLGITIDNHKSVNLPGMTAKNIPLQPNYCDCGLFVLGYVEIFLKDPDSFIYCLVQGQFPENMDWPSAPDMRVKIRKLLLGLHEEQHGTACKPKQEELNKKHAMTTIEGGGDDHLVLVSPNVSKHAPTAGEVATAPNRQHLDNLTCGVKSTRDTEPQVEGTAASSHATQDLKGVESSITEPLHDIRAKGSVGKAFDLAENLPSSTTEGGTSPANDRRIVVEVNSSPETKRLIAKDHRELGALDSPESDMEAFSQGNIRERKIQSESAQNSFLKSPSRNMSPQGAKSYPLESMITPNKDQSQNAESVLANSTRHSFSDNLSGDYVSNKKVQTRTPGHHIEQLDHDSSDINNKIQRHMTGKHLHESLHLIQTQYSRCDESDDSGPYLLEADTKEMSSIASLQHTPSPPGVSNKNGFGSMLPPNEDQSPNAESGLENSNHSFSDILSGDYITDNKNEENRTPGHHIEQPGRDSSDINNKIQRHMTGKHLHESLHLIQTQYSQCDESDDSGPYLLEADTKDMSSIASLQDRPSPTEVSHKNDFKRRFSANFRSMGQKRQNDSTISDTRNPKRAKQDSSSTKDRPGAYREDGVVAGILRKNCT